MRVNIARLLHNLQEGRMLDWCEEEALEGLDYLTVTYEEDLKDQANQLKRIERLRDYLGLDHFEPKTRLRKITTNKLEDFIENVEELRAELRKTPYRLSID